MALKDYLSLYKWSKDIKDYIKLVKVKDKKRKETTIRRDYYRLKVKHGTTNEPLEQPLKVEEYNFGEYTSSHLKKIKLQDFKRMKIKLSEEFLKREGFTFEEVNKLLGKEEDIKKFDTEEEVYV